MTSLAGEALWLRSIDAVADEGERFGIVAQELSSGLTGVDAAPACSMSPAAEKVAASRDRRRANEVVVHGMDLEGATVAVTCTDTGRTWPASVLRGAVTVSADRSGSEDAHLQGPGIHVLLLLWERPADVIVEGDPEAERFLRGR